jgi:hypothetical protein
MSRDCTLLVKHPHNAQNAGSRDSERNRLWVLKKYSFLPNSQNWGDAKCLARKLRASFVGHRRAILFLLIFARGSFSTATPDYNNYR